MCDVWVLGVIYLHISTFQARDPPSAEPDVCCLSTYEPESSLARHSHPSPTLLGRWTFHIYGRISPRWLSRWESRESSGGYPQDRPGQRRGAGCRSVAVPGYRGSPTGYRGSRRRRDRPPVKDPQSASNAARRHRVRECTDIGAALQFLPPDPGVKWICCTRFSRTSRLPKFHHFDTQEKDRRWH